MATSDDSVVVKFGAEISDLASKIGDVQDLFKGLIESFGGIAAAIGGGELFAKFVDVAQEATKETVKLSQAMGTTGDDAATLGVALGEVGSNTDAYAGAFLKFSRQLANNGESLKQYGVDVDGVRNGTVTGAQAFDQALKSVSSYKAGIDQNQVSQKLFGRGIGDVHALLRLTPELLEEARKKVEDLNLSVSQESVDASHKYVAAMADVKDVITGVEKTIGEDLIPVFTASAEQFASWGPAIVDGARAVGDFFVIVFGEIKTIVTDVVDVVTSSIEGLLAPIQAVFGTEGPGALQIFKNALGLVEAVIISFRIGFEEVVNAIKTGIAVMANSFSTFASVAERALHLDFSGAQAEWKAGLDRQNDIVQAGVDRAVQIATKGAADLNKALQAGTDQPAKPKSTPYTPPGGTSTFKPIDKNAGAKAAAERALLKAQEEAKLALIKESLTEEQAAADEGYKTGLVSLAAYYAETLKVTLDGIDATIAAKQKEVADLAKLANAPGVKPEQKLKFAAQEAQLAGQINVLEAQRNEAIVKNANAYRDAEQQRLDALAAFAAAQTKAGADDDVSKQRTALQQEVALRQVTADQEFAIEQQLENESYAALQANIAARMALIRGSEEEQAKARQALQLEGEAAEREHQNKLTDISNRAELDRKQYSIQAQQSVQQSFTTMLSSWLQGTAKMSDALRQFAVNIGNQFAQLAAKKSTDKLFDVSGINKAVDAMVDLVTSGVEKVVGVFVSGETEKTAASEAGLGERLALEAAAALQSIATWAATALVNIANFALQAAAGAFNALASIPYVGPVLAVAAAAGALATVGAFAKSIVSSAGGDDQVDADGIRLVHKDETILPASYANPLRDLLSAFDTKRVSGPPLPLSLPSSLTGGVNRLNASATPSKTQVAAAQQANGGGAGDVHFHVSAIDGASVKKFFIDNGRMIATSLQNQHRNGLRPA